MKPKRAVALDRIAGRPIYRFHRWIYRLTGGRVGASSGPGPILLLTTTGRKSGQARTTPLLYMPNGDDFVVVASNGGRTEAPAWLLNLKTDPACTVQVRRNTFPATAELLEGEAKDPLWPALTSFYAGWAHYQTLTDRQIPAVILHPH